jgi:hypothetical protein
MMKGTRGILLGLLVCGTGVGAGAAFADTAPPNLVGRWDKAVKIDVQGPRSQDSSTQFDKGAWTLVLTEQDGPTVKGTRTFAGGQVPVTCQVQDSDRISCQDDGGGVFEGQIDGAKEMTVTYRPGGGGSAMSVLVLRRQR